MNNTIFPVERILYLSKDRSLYEEISAIDFGNPNQQLIFEQVSSIKSALERLFKGEFSLVILNFPDWTESVDVITKIRRLNSPPPVVALVSSGFRHAAELLKAGAVFVVSKSTLDKQFFRQEILSAIDRKKIDDELDSRGSILQAVNFAAENFLARPDWLESIQEVLEKLGAAARADCAYVFRFDQAEINQIRITRITSWGLESDPAEGGICAILSESALNSMFSSWILLLKKGSIVHFDSDQINNNEQSLLFGSGLNSVIIIPIVYDHTLWGVMEFHFYGYTKEWSSVRLDALKAAAKIFSAALNRQAAQDKLAYLATHDYLTDLPNRMLFEDRFYQAIAHAQRSGEKVAVISLDLDQFKSVNDTFGHPIGDLVLIEVGKRIAQVLRTSDTCARIGGDEFGVIAESIHNKADVMRVMEKLNQSLNPPIVADGKKIQVSASMGAALFPDNGESLENVISAADKALYQVKGKGSLFKIYEDGQYSFLEK